MMSSYRFPQFFEKSDSQKEQLKQDCLQRRKDLLVQSKNLKKAENPDQLIEGMSDFLHEVGFSSSFIDPEVSKERGQTTNLW